jgi:hypothetical protein
MATASFSSAAENCAQAPRIPEASKIREKEILRARLCSRSKETINGDAPSRAVGAI